jgi:hypothetical protein
MPGAQLPLHKAGEATLSTLSTACLYYYRLTPARCPPLRITAPNRSMGHLNFDSQFEHTMNTPTMMADRPATPMAHEPITTIKMEDLHVPYCTPSPAPSSDPSISQAPSTPAPSTTEGGKPAKKRKSWGQVLPEPKTSLPPRKRAKTEDEKEQRRIERVKRNRLAAHNSRERKRQEYEVLQAEKDKTEAEVKDYQDRLARMEAELKFWRKKYPSEVPDAALFDIADTSADTICPAQTSTSFPSPMSMDSMESPRDSSLSPETPPSSFEGASPECDLTQYPAAVLCDLQCQTHSGTALSMASSRWPAILAYLTLFNLTLQSTRSLLSSKTFSTSRPSAMTLRHLSRSPLSAAWLTLVSISMTRHSMDSVLTPTLIPFLTAMMQICLTCREKPARPCPATFLSQQTCSTEREWRAGKGMSGAEPSDSDTHRLSRLTRSSSSSRRRRVSILRRDNRRSISLRKWENRGCGFTRRPMES